MTLRDSEAGAERRPVRIAVFASGGGSNLQAILDHLRGPAGEAARLAVVVSDKPEAGALERARRAGVATRVIPVRDRPVDAVAAETLDTLAEAGTDMVALAGYLRLVPAEVVRAFRGRIVNIHPALLPAFGGKGMYGARVHRAVLDAGCRVSGATVHLVDEHYDRGPILFQWPVPVRADDTAETLAARVLRVEHAIYPPTIEAVARAVAGGEAVRPFRVPDATTFTLAAGDAPDAWQVRRALGLE
ncbi:MAG TPA: phosphoribosylglycinamide formyltransferase [Longimicrobiales bacterium]